MKDPYIWNYNIKIKTKEGTYEYEEKDVLEAVKLVEKHPDYQEFYLQHKPKTLSKTLNKPFTAPKSHVDKD